MRNAAATARAAEDVPLPTAEAGSIRLLGSRHRRRENVWVGVAILRPAAPFDFHKFLKI